MRLFAWCHQNIVKQSGSVGEEHNRVSFCTLSWGVQGKQNYWMVKGLYFVIMNVMIPFLLLQYDFDNTKGNNINVLNIILREF